MTPTRTDEIEDRLARATAWPWESDTTPGIGDCRFDAYAVTGDDGKVVCDTLNSEIELHEDADEDGVQRWDERGRKNMDLIAHAPADLRYLLDELKKAEALKDLAKAEAEHYEELLSTARAEIERLKELCNHSEAMAMDYANQLETARADAAREEREECAKVADVYSRTEPKSGPQARMLATMMAETGTQIARGIRARSTLPSEASKPDPMIALALNPDQPQQG